jgi:hypothetical protein
VAVPASQIFFKATMRVIIRVAGLNSAAVFRSQPYSHAQLLPAIGCVLPAMYKSLQADSAFVAADRQLYSVPLSGLPGRRFLFLCLLNVLRS